MHTGLEIQILDTYGKEPMGKHDSGALYDLVPPKVNAVRPAGEWNEMRLKCQGPMTEVDLNGQRILDVDIDEYDTPGQCPDGEPSKFKIRLEGPASARPYRPPGPQRRHLVPEPPRPRAVTRRPRTMWLHGEGTDCATSPHA